MAQPVNPGAAAAAPVAQEADFAVVVERQRELLMRGEAPDVDVVRGYVASLGENGKWADINYADPTPATWSTSGHLQRVRMIARSVVDPKSPLYNDAKAEAAMGRALDDWSANKYKNPNWWHNDIGVPRIMVEVIVLLGDRLKGERREGALGILHQYGKAKAGGGTNTIWMATLAMLYGALTRDGALVAANSRMISDEIHVTKGDGIQDDNSFHQHSSRLQQFHYGGAFINETARLGWQLRGTPWAIPMNKLQIVADCVLGGSQWMVRGTTTVPGTLDRSVSRPGAMNGGDLRETARFLREALPASAPALDALVARQDGTGKPLDGYRWYPRSDFAVYQRPAFGFFLKTLSDRTLTTESINGENQRGHLLNSGDHYLLRDGEEYTQMPPVWDWEALPGVTYGRGAGEPVRQGFVGSVSDGQSGATTMDSRFASKAGAALGVKKLWASHGDVTVCLMADLTATGVEAPIHTALDQCLMRGAVTVCKPNGELQRLERGEVAAGPMKWVQHSGFAYAPLGDTPVALKLGAVTGAWSGINKSGSKQSVTVPVFLPTLEHGTAPQGAASGFVIGAAATPGEAQKLFAAPSWKVLRNDATCQAVRFNDGTVMAAFYGAGSIETEAGKQLAVDGPCLVMTSAAGVRLVDPTQKGSQVNLTMGAVSKSVTLPPGGIAVSV